MLRIYILTVILTLFVQSGVAGQQAEPTASPPPVFMNEKAHQGGILSVALSPDESKIATLGEDRLLQIRDAATGKLLWKKSVKNYIKRCNVVWSNDGSYVVSGDETGQVHFFHSKTGELYQQRRCHQKAVVQQTISPDGKMLATSSMDGFIRIWDFTTGKQLKQFPFTSWHLQFTPDSRNIAFPSNDGIQLWNVATEELEQRFFQAGHQHTEVHFALAGKLLIGQLKDNALCIWDVATGKLKETIHGISFTSSTSHETSPDGTAILTEDIEQITIWDAVTGQPLQQLKDLGTTLTGARISLGKSCVVVANREGGLALYRRKDAAKTTLLSPWKLETIEGHDDRLHRITHNTHDWRQHNKVQFSKNGQRLYWSTSETTKENQGVGIVRIWDLAGKKELGAIPTQTGFRFGHYQGRRLREIEGFAISDDEKLLAIATSDAISIWDVAAQKELYVIDGLRLNKLPDLMFPLSSDMQLRFTPSSKVLAISMTAGTWLWDMDNRKLIARADDGGHVTFLAGEKYFLAPTYGNRLKIWETKTGNMLSEIHPEQGILREGAISADQQWVIAGGEGQIVLWKLHDGATKPRVTEFKKIRPPSPVYGLSMSQDGKTMLASGGVPTWWKLPSGERQGELSLLRRSGHSCLSPDGKLAAVCGEGGVYLWKLTSE